MQVKCAIYARVSTSEQVRGYSIDAQLGACRDYAGAQGWLVVGNYTDPGHSGTGDRRPAFQKLVTDGLTGLFDVVLIHKSDRFARNRKHAITYKSLLRENGVQVISVSQPIDPDDPAGMLLEGITEVFDEWFSINLRAETLKGQWRMIETGKWPGRPPLGYKKDDDGWTRVAEMGEQITLAFNEFSTGNYTLYSWTDHAYALGIRSYNGKRIPPSSWSHIFNNRFYMGVLTWGDKSAQGKHEPLVDQDTFDKVQAALAAGVHNIKRKHYRFYLLRYLTWSLDADCPMTGAVAKGFKYYRSIKKSPADGKRHHVLSRILEAQVGSVFQAVTVNLDELGQINNQLDEPLRLALRVAPNVGVIYQQLHDSNQRRALCQLVVAKYGFKVNGHQIIDLETNPPFCFHKLDKTEVPPAGLEAFFYLIPLNYQTEVAA